MICIAMPAVIRDAIIHHARAEWPNECCGILAGVMAGEEFSVKNHYPLINELASPTAFRSEPQSMFRAMKEIRQQQMEIVAVYHSHPTTAAVPSQRDWNEITYPAAATIIIGTVNTAPSMRAWIIQDNQFVECSIFVSDF